MTLLTLIGRAVFRFALQANPAIALSDKIVYDATRLSIKSSQRWHRTRVGGDFRLRILRLHHLLAAICLSQSALEAQTVIEDKKHSACRNCITLSNQLVLGESGDSGLVAVGRGLVRLSNGNFLHAGNLDGMVLFSPTGKYLRTIGRKGSGPTEFRGVEFLLRAGEDSLYVFDRANARYVVLNNQFVQIRQAPYSFAGYVNSAAVLRSGNLVVNARVRTLDLMGQPLHIMLAKTGVLSRSFGLGNGEVWDRREAWEGWREFAVGSSGTIWASRRNKYLLEEWSSDGRLLSTILRKTSWFPAFETAIPLSPQSPPQPHLERIFIDKLNRLWTFVVVPSGSWRKNIETAPSQEGVRSGRTIPTHLSGIYDTFVEVFDLSKRQLIASQKFPGFMWGALDDDFVYGDGMTREGIPKFDVWKLKLSIPK